MTSKTLEDSKVFIKRIQLDDDGGKWIDVHLSSSAAYRIDVSFLVNVIIGAIREKNPGLGLLTASGLVLRWGQKDAKAHCNHVFRDSLTCVRCGWKP